MFIIKKIISLMLALAMAMAVMTGCSAKDKDNANDNTDPSIKQKEYNYLTGMPFSDGADKTARPVAVMINNLKIAHPQSGLTNADIVYEAVTEGGITRLMAVYSDIEKITKVGPVRSARDRFIEMMLPLNAIYVHIGSSTSAADMLNFYSYKDIDGIYLGSLAFEQNPELAKSKGPEHSWFTNKELIKAGIQNNGIATKNNFYPAFEFVPYDDDARIPQAGDANTVSFDYSSYATVGFAYNAEKGKYLKSAFGIPHMDADTNTQLDFDNVIILVTDVGIQPENGVLADIDMSGGTGYYFYGGKYEEFTWKKGEPEQPLILYGEDGEVLPINTGKSYVGILGTDQLETLVISEEVQTAVNFERVQ